MLAVDLAEWIFQATSQPATAELFTPEGQVAKVVFERAANWLRHGCIPIGVIDGVPPPEKLARMKQRHGMGATGCGGGVFGRLGDVAARTLRALGLPAVEAPGEAEATCAAMNAAGLVDGCATSDGDALLFGARVQFKTIKLFADAPEQSRIERCEASWLRETMRLPGDEHEGVSDALVALALLAGGDYDPDGAKRVGSALASRVVKGLAAEDARERRKSGSPGLRPSTTTLPRRLDAFLEAPADDDLEAIGKRGCTGCVRCKHEGGGKCKKQRHVHGCEACGTESGCVERDGPCECAFHSTEDLRWMDKVRRRAKATEGYVGGSFQRAAKAYAKQASIAAAALPRARDVAAARRGGGGGSFSRLAWTRRPDTAAVSEILALCDIPDRRAREKLLPVLLEWDIRAAAVTGAPSAGLEFTAASITKVAGHRGVGRRWRYLLEIAAVDPNEAVNAARLKAQLKAKRAAANTPGGAREIALDDDDDEDGLGASEIARDLEFLSHHRPHRSVRMGLIREAFPELVAAFEAPPTPKTKTKGKGMGGKTPGVKRVDPKTPTPRKTTPRKTTPRGIPRERSPTQHAITGSMRSRKTLFPDAPAATSIAEALRTPVLIKADAHVTSPLSVGSEGSEELLTGGLTSYREKYGYPTTGKKPPPVEAAAAAAAGVGDDEVKSSQEFASPTPAQRARERRDSVEVVDLVTPPSPETRARATAAAGGGGGGGSSLPSSPLVSPTKRMRQEGIKAFMSPAKKPATPKTSDSVVVLSDSDED